MYIYQSSGAQFQYILTGTDGSIPPTVLVSFVELSETALESIATALCGGTPPTGYTIAKDDHPVVTKTY